MENKKDEDLKHVYETLNTDSMEVLYNKHTKIGNKLEAVKNALDSLQRNHSLDLDTRTYVHATYDFLSRLNKSIEFKIGAINYGGIFLESKLRSSDSKTYLNKDFYIQFLKSLDSDLNSLEYLIKDIQEKLIYKITSALDEDKVDEEDLNNISSNFLGS